MKGIEIRKEKKRKGNEKKERNHPAGLKSLTWPNTTGPCAMRRRHAGPAR
jgi:hypothetical protein